MNVRFCVACRSLILSDFRFCPYCGAAVKGPELSEALAGPFSAIAESGGKQNSSAAKADVFAGAEERLSRLEADMDLLIEALEKEGRSSS